MTDLGRLNPKNTIVFVVVHNSDPFNNLSFSLPCDLASPFFFISGARDKMDINLRSEP